MAEKEGEKRKLTQEEFDEIVERHRKWRALSPGEQLKRETELAADLANTDLSGLDAAGRDLVRARLTGSRLTGMKLDGATLSYAELSEADVSCSSCCGTRFVRADLRQTVFRGADLTEAEFAKFEQQEPKIRDAADALTTDFRDAWLCRVDLNGLKHLTAQQLGGADLTGAALPDLIAASHESALNAVAEGSKKAGRVFTMLLSLCGLTLLTMLTALGVKHVASGVTAPLPLIQSSVPLVGFYRVAPLALLGFYVYLHFYMAHIWELIGTLPALFPDGTPLDRKLYPWLLLRISKEYLPRLGVSGLADRFTRWAVRGFLWWVAPLLILAMWMQTLPVGDSLTTFILGLALLATVAAGLVFHVVTAAKLSQVNWRVYLGLPHVEEQNSADIASVRVAWPDLCRAPRARWWMIGLAAAAAVVIVISGGEFGWKLYRSVSKDEPTERCAPKPPKKNENTGAAHDSVSVGEASVQEDSTGADSIGGR